MPKGYDIKEAVEACGFSESYIRTLIRRGSLKTTKVPLSPGSLVSKHIITKEELARFLEEAPHKSRRHDTRNKFVLYARPDEIALVIKALHKAGLDDVADLIVPANRLAYWPVEREEPDA